MAATATKHRGKHRMDEVGSLAWSDEGCLISEQMERRIRKQIGIREDALLGTPDCEQ